MDIGLPTLIRKNTHVTETATEEIDTAGCYGLPESLQDTHMNDSVESQKETTDRKMEVFSAKTKTRAMYETGKLAKVTAEIKRCDQHFLGISKSRWTGSGRYRTNRGETVLYSGRGEDQHRKGVTVILS